MVTLAVLIVVLGGGGYFGYRMLFGESTEGVAVKPAEPATTLPAQPGGPPKDATVTAPTPQPPANETATMQAPGKPEAQDAKSAGAQATPDAASAVAGSTTDKGPGTAAAKTDAGKLPRTTTPPPLKAAAPPTTPATTTTTTTEQPSRTVATPSRNVAPAAGAQPDRWQQMAEAMSHCAREDFFSRVGCEQRVGRRFCEGFWGTVPQCPGAPRGSGQ